MTKHRKKRITKLSGMTAVERKKYDHDYHTAYYLAHREKAKEYARQWNLLQKKKPKKQRSALKRERFVTHDVYNAHDLMHSPAEKTLKMLQKIIAGERAFTV